MQAETGGRPKLAHVGEERDRESTRECRSQGHLHYKIMVFDLRRRLKYGMILIWTRIIDWVSCLLACHRVSGGGWLFMLKKNNAMELRNSSHDELYALRRVKIEKWRFISHQLAQHVNQKEIPGLDASTDRRVPAVVTLPPSNLGQAPSPSSPHQDTPERMLASLFKKRHSDVYDPSADDSHLSGSERDQQQPLVDDSVDTMEANDTSTPPRGQSILREGSRVNNRLTYSFHFLLLHASHALLSTFCVRARPFWRP